MSLWDLTIRQLEWYPALLQAERASGPRPPPVPVAEPAPVGQRFGRLIVLGEGERYSSPGGRANRRWRCLCDACKTECLVAMCRVKAMKTTHCGCLRTYGPNRTRKAR